MNRTLYSATLSIEGKGCNEMVDEWQGTLKWISQSSYRDSSSAKELVSGGKCVYCTQHKRCRH